MTSKEICVRAAVLGRVFGLELTDPEKVEELPEDNAYYVYHNDVEVLVHELAHAAVLRLPVFGRRWNRDKDLNYTITEHLDSWIHREDLWKEDNQRERQDLHECRALAIQVLVMRDMGLGTNLKEMTETSARDMNFFSATHAQRKVREFVKLISIKRHAARVTALIMRA